MCKKFGYFKDTPCMLFEQTGYKLSQFQTFLKETLKWKINAKVPNVKFSPKFIYLIYFDTMYIKINKNIFNFRSKLIILTWAWVNNTLRLRRCVKGNCNGFESVTLHVARLPILAICPIEVVADPPINLVTAKLKYILKLSF